MEQKRKCCRRKIHLNEVVLSGMRFTHFSDFLFLLRTIPSFMNINVFFKISHFREKIKQNGNEINAFVVQRGTPCSANKEGNL